MDKLLEQAKDIKAVFFDIDDTLRVKDSGFMPESLNKVFDMLREKGIVTGIATGRSYYGVIPEIQALKPDYFVTLNGAHVQDAEHKEIYKNPFSEDLVEEVIAWAKQEGIDYAFVANDNVLVSNPSSMVEDSIVPIYGPVEADPDFYKDHDIYQMLTMTERNVDDTLTDSLDDQIRLVRWHKYSSDIVKKEGSKAVGVSKVVDKLNIKPENLLVFGDGLNDREIFDYAGFSVAMKVSHPELKEKASFVTDTVENDGILKALEKLEII